MNFEQIVEQLKAKLTDPIMGEPPVILFGGFVDELTGGIINAPGSSLPPDWRQRDLADRDVEYLYGFALDTLTKRAVHFANRANDPVYDLSTEIANALREVLMDNFPVELPLVEIKSPTQMMLERGLLEVVGQSEDGDPLVKLTPEGEALAESVAHSIHANDN